MGQSLQDSSALDRSAALIEQGIELYDNEKYDEAQALLTEVADFDSATAIRARVNGFLEQHGLGGLLRVGKWGH